MANARVTFPYIRDALVVGSTLAALSLAPTPAEACGGFFCNATPVVQAGEEIVYVVDDDGTLTMSVRIYYAGDAPDFAWILPVPETPEITLGTAALFDQLGQATQPYFYVGMYRTEGTCRRYPTCDFPPRPDAGLWWGGGSDAAVTAVDAAAADGSGPTIFLEGTLGPYETVVIGGSSATEIHDWLTANGYDIPASAVPMLDEYVAAGERFVALRLRTDASTSEIQPVTLGFGSVLPCLPIRLTAIATQPDLPITAYFLASSRATPRNYSLIETPYPASLFLGTVPYTQWVANEADDLGGRAFIADYAGATPSSGSFYLELPGVTDLATETDAGRLVSQIWGRGYSGDPQLLALLQRFVVPPDGSDPRSYYNCLASGGFGCGTPAAYDPAGLVAAIDETITQPRAAASAWVTGHAYTTRLYTTMSAEEMTFDPEFVLDSGLDDVSNAHVATDVAECDATHFPEDAPHHIELPDGTTAPYYPGRPSPTDAEYCEARGGWLHGTPSPFDAGRVDAGMRIPGGGGSACSATPGRQGLGAGLGVALFVLGALLRARRRA